VESNWREIARFAGNDKWEEQAMNRRSVGKRAKFTHCNAFALPRIIENATHALIIYYIPSRDGTSFDHIVGDRFATIRSFSIIPPKVIL
jgi:hypothetical protein